jgi:hypothetical protein
MPGVTVEAASPVLIEKVRTVVTDDQGLYRIIDLRPGTYTVTFTLVGFSTVKREGIELTANFTATVNAELKVGQLEETITVSGQSPTVDVQNVVQQRVLSTTALESLPTAKSIQSMTALIPGLSAGITSQDVGGTVGDQPAGVAIHGGRNGDQHIFYDGMRTNNTQSGGGGSSQSIFFNPASIAEISMEVGNLAIQSETGGVVVNVIPKDGGNSFSGSVLAIGANGSLQSNNLTDALRARGLTATTKIKNIFDLNAAVGGPIVKDRVWFFTAHRRWGNENYVAARYFNATPLAWISTPDLSRPAYEQNLHHSNNARVTWQVTQKDKISGAYELQGQCLCYTGLGSYGGANASPEATQQVRSFPNDYAQLRWTRPISNRLLLEAGVSWNRMNWNGAPQPGVAPDVISITELSTNLTYRAPSSYNGRLRREAVYSQALFTTANISYVTGSHNFKVGTMVLQGWPHTDTQVNGDMTYQFLNGVPRTVVLRATPLFVSNRLTADAGIYAQDQWRVSRLTLNLALRYTDFNAAVPAQHVAAGRFVPARDYPAIPSAVRWQDLSPRVGAAFDLFGDGKTALKASLSRYLNGDAAGAANAKNPQNTVDSQATRTWSDDNRDYVPDCDLLNPVANGECGPLSNRNFGKPSLVTTTYDNAVIHGWGKRFNNSEVSAGIQHTLWQGVSVSGTYFRRWYGNFQVTDNLAVAPSDYDPYCVTPPFDPRLPGGGGNQICGFYDLNPRKVGQISNYVTFAKNYGKMTDVYDGVDLTVNARLARGATLQGGASIGREATNMCDVVGKVDLPAAALPFSSSTGGAPLAASLSGLPSPSTNFCHVSPPFQPDVKLNGSYPLPWGGVQLSATFQSIPGPQIVATAVVPSTQIASSLGRNLSAGANSTATVQLVAPGTLYGDRLNQVDLRVTKMVRVNRTRVRGMFDLYNLLNASPVLALNQRYGPAWQQPYITLPGRFMKFGVQMDF